MTIKPILVEEDGFTFVRYVDDNGDEADIDIDVDIDEILHEVRNERIDKIIATFQLPIYSKEKE